MASRRHNCDTSQFTKVYFVAEIFMLKLNTLTFEEKNVGIKRFFVQRLLKEFSNKREKNSEKR